MNKIKEFLSEYNVPIIITTIMGLIFIPFMTFEFFVIEPMKDNLINHIHNDDCKTLKNNIIKGYDGDYSSLQTLAEHQFLWRCEK